MLSHLARWLDRLILFGFQVEHNPGAKVGMADYLFRNLNSLAETVSNYGKLITATKLVSIRNALNFAKSKLFRESDIKVSNNSNEKVLTKQNVVC